MIGRAGMHGVTLLDTTHCRTPLPDPAGAALASAVPSSMTVPIGNLALAISISAGAPSTTFLEGGSNLASPSEAPFAEGDTVTLGVPWLSDHGELLLTFDVADLRAAGRCRGRGD